MKKLLKQTNKQGVLKLQVERTMAAPGSPTFSYPSLRHLRSYSMSPSDVTPLSPQSSVVTQDEDHMYKPMNGSAAVPDEISPSELPSRYSEGFGHRNHAFYRQYDRRSRSASNGSTSSGGEAPSKLVSITTQRRQGKGLDQHAEGDFNERRIEFHRFVDVETSQEDSQPYSSCEYLPDGYASISQSVSLTFNEFPAVMHNNLTVATLPTQDPGTYFEREDQDRRTMRWVGLGKWVGGWVDLNHCTAWLAPEVRIRQLRMHLSGLHCACCAGGETRQLPTWTVRQWATARLRHRTAWPLAAVSRPTPSMAGRGEAADSQDCLANCAT